VIEPLVQAQNVLLADCLGYSLKPLVPVFVGQFVLGQFFLPLLSLVFLNSRLPLNQIALGQQVLVFFSHEQARLLEGVDDGGVESCFMTSTMKCSTCSNTIRLTSRFADHMGGEPECIPRPIPRPTANERQPLHSYPS
jgi:hypothetical protein